MFDFNYDEMPKSLIKYIKAPIFHNDPTFLHFFYNHYKEENDINIIFLMRLKNIGKYHYFPYACLAQYFMRTGESRKALFILKEGISNNCHGKEKLISIRNMMKEEKTEENIMPKSIFIFGVEWLIQNSCYAEASENYGFLEIKANDFLRKLEKEKNDELERQRERAEKRESLVGDQIKKRRRRSIVEMIKDSEDKENTNPSGVENIELLEDGSTKKQGEAIMLFGEQFFCSPKKKNVQSINDVILEENSQFKIEADTYVIREIGDDFLKITSIENFIENHTFTCKEYILRMVRKQRDLDTVKDIVPMELIYLSINGQLYVRYQRPFLYTLRENFELANENICVYFASEAIKILKILYERKIMLKLSLSDFNVVEEDDFFVLKITNLDFQDEMEFDEFEEILEGGGIVTGESLNVIEDYTLRRIKQMNLADEMIEHKMRLLNGICTE